MYPFNAATFAGFILISDQYQFISSYLTFLLFSISHLFFASFIIEIMASCIYVYIHVHIGFLIYLIVHLSFQVFIYPCKYWWWILDVVDFECIRCFFTRKSGKSVAINQFDSRIINGKQLAIRGTRILFKDYRLNIPRPSISSYISTHLYHFHFVN